MAETFRGIDITKVHQEVDCHNKSTQEKLRFDIKFFVFSVFQLLLANLLVFKHVRI